MGTNNMDNLDVIYNAYLHSIENENQAYSNGDNEETIKPLLTKADFKAIIKDKEDSNHKFSSFLDILLGTALSNSDDNTIITGTFKNITYPSEYDTYVNSQFVALKDGNKSAVFFKNDEQTAFVMRELTDRGTYYFEISPTKTQVGYAPNNTQWKQFSDPSQIASHQKDYLDAYLVYFPGEKRTLRNDINLTLDNNSSMLFYQSIYDFGIERIYSNEYILAKLEEDAKQASIEIEKETPKEEDLDKNILRFQELLTQLDSMGIEPTPEQMQQLEVSKRFKLFKENSAKREESQRLERERIAEDNERKEAWWSSPENPSNIHHEEIMKALEQAEKESQVLDNINETGMRSFLSAEQINSLEESKEFERMMQEATNTTNNLDNSMSPEIRSWYQNHYGTLEAPYEGKKI